MYNINPDGCFALAIPNTGITALNLNQEINLFGSCTKIYTTEVVTYPVIQDEPTHLEKDYGWKKNLKVGIAEDTKQRQTPFTG